MSKVWHIVYPATKLLQNRWLAKSGCQNLKLARNMFPPFLSFWSPAFTFSVRKESGLVVAIKQYLGLARDHWDWYHLYCSGLWRMDLQYNRPDLDEANWLAGYVKGVKTIVYIYYWFVDYHLFLISFFLNQTLTHGCLKVHGGVPIVLCIFVDPL